MRLFMSLMMINFVECFRQINSAQIDSTTFCYKPVDYITHSVHSM